MVRIFVFGAAFNQSNRTMNELTYFPHYGLGKNSKVYAK